GARRPTRRRARPIPRAARPRPRRRSLPPGRRRRRPRRPSPRRRRRRSDPTLSRLGYTTGPMPRFHTVLFDLDGTLIDSIRLILDSYHHTFAAHGMPPRSDAELGPGTGIPPPTTFGAVPRDPAQIH